MNCYLWLQLCSSSTEAETKEPCNCLNFHSKRTFIFSIQALKNHKHNFFRISIVSKSRPRDEQTQAICSSAFLFSTAQTRNLEFAVCGTSKMAASTWSMCKIKMAASTWYMCKIKMAASTRSICKIKMAAGVNWLSVKWQPIYGIWFAMAFICYRQKFNFFTKYRLFIFSKDNLLQQYEAILHCFC